MSLLCGNDSLHASGFLFNCAKNIIPYLDAGSCKDQLSIGWLEQLAARIADNWGNFELSKDLQRRAYSHNRNLTRPIVLPPYRALPIPGSQSQTIVKLIGEYRQRRGFLQDFEEVVSVLHPNSTAHQFEDALCRFAKLIGFLSERHDDNGDGPDVLWLLPNKTGLVIEAKSRKKENNPLTKKEHGQLLVAAEWFTKNYPDYKCVRVSMHPNNKATKAAAANTSYALTNEKLAIMISDARVLLSSLCDSQINEAELLVECDKLLSTSNIRSDRIVDKYLCLFIEED